jgi:hypothetical protein
VIQNRKAPRQDGGRQGAQRFLSDGRPSNRLSYSENSIGTQEADAVLRRRAAARILPLR